MHIARHVCVMSLFVCFIALRPRQTAGNMSGRSLILTDKPPRGSLPVIIIHSFDARLESAEDEEWP